MDTAVAVESLAKATYLATVRTTAIANLHIECDRMRGELAEAKAEIKSITNDYLESSHAQMARYEMQLAEAKAESALIATLKQRIQAIADERDELRNKLAEAQSEIDCRTLDFARMRDERDEARGCLRYLRDHDIYDTLTRHDKAKIANALKEETK
jgi:chromosome segregation ATPase